MSLQVLNETQRLRVVLIITDYGSFNNFLSEVAVKLIKEGNKVDVICSRQKVINFSDKYNYQALGIIFHFIEFPRSYNPFKQISTSKKINKVIEDIAPDIINIHFTTGIFTTVLWKKPKQFTIGTIHGIGYAVINNIGKKIIFKAVEKFCFKRLDQVYLLNQSDYELVKSFYPEKARIYNSLGVGCNLNQFDNSRFNEQDKSALRNELGIKSSDFVLAFTGRFVSFKGFNLVVNSALSLVKESNYKNLKLLLIGGEDGVHATGLSEEEEKEYKNKTEIIKIGFTNEVDKYLSISDLFVFPSVKEGMPVCIMEALAMGVPVITSDTRGCNELVENNLNGVVLSDKPTVEETRNAIEQLMNNRNLLHKFSDNALSQRHLLDRNRYVDEQVDVYRKVLATLN